MIKVLSIGCIYRIRMKFGRAVALPGGFLVHLAPSNSSTVLSIFRTNQLMAGILLLGYAGLLQASAFWVPNGEIVAGPGAGNVWPSAWLNAAADYWEFALVVMLLFVQGLLANAVIFAHRINTPPNLFPGVFVILLGSLLPEFGRYSGYWVANVFLLLSLRSYLKAFRVNNAADHIYNTGTWIGIAALFAPTYLVFLVAYGATLPVLKSGRFRDQFILLIGAAVPLYLVAIGYYWTDAMPVYWEQQWTSAFSLPHLVDGSNIPYVKMLLMAAMLFLVISRRGRYQSKTKMEVQIKIDILYWLLLAGGVSVLWAMPWDLQQWQAVVPIAGILLSFSFTRATNPAAEAWHLLLLLIVFYLHFAPVLGFPLV